MAHGILVIEDEPTLAKNIKTYLKKYDYEVRIACDGKEGLQAVESFKPDLVLLDLQLPDFNGLEILGKIKKIDSPIVVIIMTAHGQIHIAVDAIKAGAYDFLSKPLVLKELKVLLDKAIRETRTQGALSYYQEKEASEAIFGKSKEILSLKEQIAQLNYSERMLTEGAPPTVLITGETGTGKGLVARSLHYAGPRKKMPFVQINCSSIPEQLLEAELFGYERGAFTDAKEKKCGLFEAADKGTLFLDEIGDIHISLQAKLLKVLEEKVIRRLGSLLEKKIDVRIMAATNQSLEKLIQNGQFRTDLYFRLNIIQINPPPLRKMGKDILLLANHFLKIQCMRYKKKIGGFTPEAENLLLTYAWPGNVRELRNMMEQVVFLSQQEIIRAEDIHLNAKFVKMEDGEKKDQMREGQFILPPEGISMEEVERGFVVQALTQAAWNVTNAAQLLGLSRDTLRYRMEKYRLSPPSKKQ